MALFMEYNEEKALRVLGAMRRKNEPEDLEAYYNQPLTPFMREIIMQVAELTPGLQKVILFGSRATGFNKPNSDIDLAIERDEESPRSSVIFWILMEESQLPFNFDLVDLSEKINPALRAEIEREGVVLWERGKKDVASVQ